jgi:hypothetical protein
MSLIFLRSEIMFKGTVQRDGSGRNWAHSIGLYKRKRRGGFLEKFAHPPSNESPLKYESAYFFSIANYAENIHCALGPPLTIEKRRN